MAEKKHVLVLADSLDSATPLLKSLAAYDVTIGVMSGQNPSQDNLTFQLDDYDSLVKVFQLAAKRHGSIDQVIGFFPRGLPDVESEADKVSVSSLSLIAIWITKLATFHFRQSEKLPGEQGLVIVAPAPASKDNESPPLSAVGNNSLLGLLRSIHPQAFFEGFRFSIVYSVGFEVEAEQRSAAAAVITAISQEEKLTLESNGKIILSNGKTIENHETTMSGVQGYRKLGGRLVGAAALKIGIRKNVKRAVKQLEATGVPMSTVQLGFVALAFLTLSWLAWRGWIPPMAYMVFGALIWRSYPSRNNNSQSFRAKKDGETCSTAVFLGSGGHTGEAIQLLFALDTTRYTPRTYIFCTGDNISLTKATSFENDLIKKSPKDVSSGKTSTESPSSYRLVELPRARRVAQSYFSAIGTTTYSLLVTLWKLAVEPIVKGDLKQIPDLLIVNGPGTCVVVVLVYKLLKLVGQRSPQIIYVESFARVNSLSLSGKILKNVVDEFIVQWPVEGYVAGQDAGSNGTASKAQDPKLQYQGWLI